MPPTDADTLSPAARAQLAPNWSSFVSTTATALAIAVLLAIAYQPAEVCNWTLLFTDTANMVTFATDFLRPDFTDWRLCLDKMLETVYIALWGTFLSTVFGIPFALLSSSNVAPWWIVQPVPRVMDATRAINAIVFAILFVAAVGLGPFAGVMAVFIHNLGIISKLFSEAVEAIDPRPVEGIRSTGATRLQEIGYGIIPPGAAAVVITDALAFRDQRALGHRARHRRRRRDRRGRCRGHTDRHPLRPAAQAPDLTRAKTPRAMPVANC